MSLTHAKSFLSLRYAKTSIAAALTLIAFALPGAGAAAGEPERGRVEELTIQSAAMAGNLIGDSATRTSLVYLPPGYDDAPTTRYPVVYLLHGYDGRPRDWTDDGRYSWDVPRRLDAAIASGAVHPAIYVFPDATNGYHGTFYADSTATGRWEEHFVHELVPAVDARYRTLPRVASRGLAGHSMGGYGAVALGMKHADLFGAIYAHAPCCLALFDSPEDISDPSPLWSVVAGFTKREQLSNDLDSDEVLYENLFVAMSAAFSPDPGHPPFFADFPIVERDGKLQRDPATHERWKAKTPIYLLDAYGEALARLRGFVIELGVDESFPDVRRNAPKFERALSERGIPHRFEIYAGGNHQSLLGQRIESHLLPFFSETLDSAAP